MKIKSNNRLLTNMLSYAILQIVNLLVGLVLPRLYLSVYGSEINGVISTVNSFTTYFAYLEAGLGLTLIHALFKPLVDNDNGEINGILSFSKKQYQKISCVYFALVVILAAAFPMLSTTSAINKLEFMSLVLVIGGYGALDFYTMAKYRVLLTADRKEYVISYATILAQLLRFVFVWTLLKFDLSVVFVKATPIFTLIIRSAILKLYVRKKYPNVDFSAPITTNISATGHRWDALLLQISISTSVSLPTIIISQVLGFTEANIYAIYSLVISAVVAIISALSSGVSPMLGAKLANGENIRDLYNIYDYVVSFVLALAFSITAVMILPFVELYTNVTSDVNYSYPIYAVLISLWGALYSYRIPITAVINAAGIYRENRVNNIINLSIQIVLGVVFTLLWGIPGALLVMIIAAVHRNISLGLVNERKLLGDIMWKNIIRQVIISLIVVTSWYISKFALEGVEFDASTWVLVASIVCVIELVICVLVFAASEPKLAKKMFIFVKNKIAKVRQ